MRMLFLFNLLFDFTGATVEMGLRSISTVKSVGSSVGALYQLVVWCKHDVAGLRPATSSVHYTTSCNTQSSAPEDGQNNFPKHVELTGIINKPLLLHLVGCLCYLYQWCNVKQISDNEIYLLIKYIKSVLWRVAKRLS